VTSDEFGYKPAVSDDECKKSGDEKEEVVNRTWSLLVTKKNKSFKNLNLAGRNKRRALSSRSLILKRSHAKQLDKQKIDKSVDLWAFGCIAYYLAASTMFHYCD